MELVWAQFGWGRRLTGTHQLLCAQRHVCGGDAGRGHETSEWSKNRPYLSADTARLWWRVFTCLFTATNKKELLETGWNRFLRHSSVSFGTSSILCKYLMFFSYSLHVTWLSDSTIALKIAPQIRQTLLFRAFSVSLIPYEYLFGHVDIIYLITSSSCDTVTVNQWRIASLYQTNT